MVDQQKLNILLVNTGDLCLKRRAKLIINELDLKKDDKILDVGCGDGFYLYLLSRLGEFNLVGIDSNRESVASAKRQAGSKKARFIVGDIYRMQYKDGEFNKLVCSEVLEHLPDDKRGLLEMKRVLKKGGIICATVPHLNYPFFWDPVNYILQRVFGTHIKSGFWAGVWNMHERLYKDSELKKLFKETGFVIERFEYVTHYGLPFNHYLMYIGFRMRTSKSLPDTVRQSLSKFEGNKKTWFSYVLAFINWLDKRNDKKFTKDVSTVGLFVKARKI